METSDAAARGLAIVSVTPDETPTPAPDRKPRLPWIVAAVLAVLAVLYFTADWVVAYTEDAYVRSDFVAVAPQVAGVIKSVVVTDDQKVAAGDPLAFIDDEPFTLVGRLKQRRVDSAEAEARVRQDGAQVIAADIGTARAALTLAEREYQRIRSLVNAQDLSQAEMDRATDQRQQAIDALAEMQAKARVNTGEVTAALAEVDIAKAELAVAAYELSRTRITAPVSGYVNNLSLRPGAYASVGTPLVGLVDDNQWRIMANFKEYVAARLKPGMRAWVWLDSHPWHLFPARVVGVSRGISREQEADRLLPYVAPTTDWIRLKRRLPVTLVLDPWPKDVPLFMGADARVLLFP